MTRFTPLWLQAGSYAASVDRRLIGALWPAAASSGCAVTFQTGTMLVNIAAGSVAVPAQNGSGSTLCTSDFAEQVTIGAAPSAPNNRIDVVTCHPRGNDLDGGANTDFIFDVIVGAVAATPVVPAVPAGQVALAQVYVGGGVASIVQANITDVRPFGLAVAGAGALPPPVTSGTTIQSFTDSSGLVFVAKNGVNGGAWRRARDVLQARWYRAAAFTVAAFAQVTLDGITRDAYGLLSAGGFVAPVAGVYAVKAAVGATLTIAGQYLTAAIYQQGTARSQVTLYGSANPQYWDVPVADNVLCAAGDTVQLWGRSSASAAGSAAANETFMSINYQGTG